MQWTTFIGAVVVAALAAACGPTEPAGSLFVDARLPLDTLVAGGWTEVTVRATNGGEAPVQLAGPRCYALRYRVLDPAGTEVFPAGASWECGVLAAAATPPIDPDVMIGAGGVASVVHLWQAVHGYNTAGGLRGAVGCGPLSPGAVRGPRGSRGSGGRHRGAGHHGCGDRGVGPAAGSGPGGVGAATG